MAKTGAGASVVEEIVHRSHNGNSEGAAGGVAVLPADNRGLIRRKNIDTIVTGETRPVPTSSSVPCAQRGHRHGLEVDATQSTVTPYETPTTATHGDEHHLVTTTCDGSRTALINTIHNATFNQRQDAQ